MCPRRPAPALCLVVPGSRAGRAYLRRPSFRVSSRYPSRSVALQVVQQPAPAADHLQQAAPRVVVLLVRLQVLGEPVDPLGQDRDLHLGEPVSVSWRRCPPMTSALASLVSIRSPLSQPRRSRSRTGSVHMPGGCAHARLATRTSDEVSRPRKRTGRSPRTTRARRAPADALLSSRQVVRAAPACSSLARCCRSVRHRGGGADIRSLVDFNRREWSVLGPLSMVGFFEVYDVALLTLAAPVIATGLGVAIATFGIGVAVIRLATLGSLPLMRLADRWGRRTLLLASLALFTLATGMTASPGGSSPSSRCRWPRASSWRPRRASPPLVRRGAAPGPPRRRSLGARDRLGPGLRRRRGHAARGPAHAARLAALLPLRAGAARARRLPATPPARARAFLVAKTQNRVQTTLWPRVDPAHRRRRGGWSRSSASSASRRRVGSSTRPSSRRPTRLERVFTALIRRQRSSGCWASGSAGASATWSAGAR